MDLDVFLRYLDRLDNFVPASISFSEKPDFIITKSGRKIGIEHTRWVYQEWVRANKLHAAECPELSIQLTNLKDGKSRRTNEQLLESMTSFEASWKNSEYCHLDWKNKIAATLESKRKKFIQTDYQLFDENWLLIHDVPSLPNNLYTKEWSSRYLNNLFLETLSVSRDFDSVYVHSGNYLFRWYQKGLDLANILFLLRLALVEKPREDEGELLC